MLNIESQRVADCKSCEEQVLHRLNGTTLQQPYVRIITVVKHSKAPSGDRERLALVIGLAQNEPECLRSGLSRTSLSGCDRSAQYKQARNFLKIARSKAASQGNALSQGISLLTQAEWA